MRTVTVILNGETYKVEELRRRANQTWRERIEAEFQELAGAQEGAGDIELTSGANLGSLVRAVAGKVVSSVDIIAHLVADYAPHLKPVLDEAYDSEVLEAFTSVLSLAYPFGQMLERIRALGGSRPLPTPPNSA